MGIVADLTALDLDQRRALILQHFAELPTAADRRLLDRTLAKCSNWPDPPGTS